MNIKTIITTIAIGLLLTTATFGQNTKSVIDYLGLKKTISFDEVSYNLAWTTHPTENYYKQEYLAKEDKIENFKRLVTIDLLVGNEKVKDIVSSKIEELEKMKTKDPIVNYRVFEKDEEVILDFLLSQNKSDGKNLSLVERNVYRYKNVTLKNGQKALLLFAVSDRAYGDDINHFFTYLQENSFELINSVGVFKIPEIIISK